MNSINIMVDLETLGTDSKSGILTIGAVEFSAAGLGQTFYQAVDPVSVQKLGFVIDASTMVWWIQQNVEAQVAAFTGSSSLPDALAAFSGYVETVRVGLGTAKSDVKIWGNGASFDNVILRNAYQGIDMEPPWKFWNDRCFRTLKGEFPDVPGPGRTGTAHNALDDACNQALHAVDILRYKQLLMEAYLEKKLSNASLKCAKSLPLHGGSVDESQI